MGIFYKSISSSLTIRHPDGDTVMIDNKNFPDQGNIKICVWVKEGKLTLTSFNDKLYSWRFPAGNPEGRNYPEGKSCYFCN